MPPSDGDTCHNKHPPWDWVTYSYTPIPPAEDGYNDTPLSPDGDGYNGASISSDRDAHNDTLVPPDGNAYDDTFPSDGDAYNGTPPPSYADIHHDEQSSMLTNENALGDTPPSDEPVFLGPIENYVQDNQNGTSECLWVSRNGSRCKFVSRWELVKRHIKRTHYHER